MPVAGAGALRHRIQVQERTTTQDAWGEPLDTWTTVLRLWAELRDLSGREFLEARQVEGAAIATRLRIRWRPDVHEGQRVVIGGRVLEVAAVLDPDGRRRWLELACTEVRR